MTTRPTFTSGPAAIAALLRQAYAEHIAPIPLTGESAWLRVLREDWASFDHPNEALRSRDPGQGTRATATPRPGGLPGDVGAPSHEQTPDDIAPAIGSPDREKARRLRGSCNARREVCHDSATGPHCTCFGDRGWTCCRCKCRPESHL